jgi:hypothetical protein
MAARRAVERGSGVAWSSSAPTGCIDKLEPVKSEFEDEGIIAILEKN